MTASRMSLVWSGAITTSPSSRGPAGSPSESMGNERTSVGATRPRCSRLSSRIRSLSTNSTATWPSSIPAEASAIAVRRSISRADSSSGARSTSTSSTAPVRRAQTGRLAGAVLVVGVDDPLDELVADDVLTAEAHEVDVLEALEDLADHDEPRLLVARQVDLRDVAGHDHLRAEPEPREEHLHLLGRGVLGLVEDDEAVVQRPAAHERERRDLDRPPLEVLGDLLGVEHVLQRVEQRAQIGVDLRHQVAGQEAEPLARLDGGAREDDAVDLAALERRRGHRHRQPRLARARGPDAEGDGVAPDRVHVALLHHALGRDLERAVTPDDVLEHACGRLVRVERAGHRGDRALRQLVARAHEVGHLTHDLLGGVHGLLAALERDDVAAQEHVGLEVALERLEHRVAAAGQLLGRLVVDLDLGPHAPWSASLTFSETRLPSARPATCAIATGMTWPMSRGDSAPLCAIASATIRASSSSPSSAGR